MAGYCVQLWSLKISRNYPLHGCILGLQTLTTAETQVLKIIMRCIEMSCAFQCVHSYHNRWSMATASKHFKKISSSFGQLKLPSQDSCGDCMADYCVQLWSLKIIRNYPLLGYILGLLTITTAGTQVLKVITRCTEMSWAIQCAHSYHKRWSMATTTEHFKKILSSFGQLKLPSQDSCGVSMAGYCVQLWHLKIIRNYPLHECTSFADTHNCWNTSSQNNHAVHRNVLSISV